MYNDNPTLEGVKLDLDTGRHNTPLGEERQGEILEMVNSDAQKKFYIESYGCAMNFSDSEIVASILSSEGYSSTKVMEESDLILVNTCSIREKAEYNVRQRLRIFEKNKKKGALVGVLGCMAERLKKKFLEEERLVDMVVGPDAYRDLPNLISGAEEGEKGVNVFLSKEETY
ncbi:MAG: tRNA (N6-isopentenyl adenosine(37)-C2)-methylthiotransferase MiaB, partial [Saprospiraceae bacterium]|nr:tRNA (N6-isopentenyl adenosine(37)-C2)-methylthiotransferase MiaB [Saprospiraceae bacterium]